MAPSRLKCTNCGWEGIEQFFHGEKCRECCSVPSHDFLVTSTQGLWLKMDRFKSMVRYRGKVMTLDAYYRINKGSHPVTLQANEVDPEAFQIVKYVPKGPKVDASKRYKTEQRYGARR